MKESLAGVVQIVLKSRKTGIAYWHFPPYWLNQQPRETFGIGLAGCYL